MIIEKIRSILLITALLIFFSPVYADNGNEPVLLDSTTNLYKAGKIYLSGQLDKEQFESLAKKNVKLVINLRTDQEMEAFEKENFNEADYINNDLKIQYLQVPTGGNDGYNKEITKAVGEAIGNLEDGDVLIHCRSAGRATLVWMAWMVNYTKTDINEAERLGKMARFTFPFEDLVGSDIKMKKSKK